MYNFAGECSHCGKWHAGVCPKIRAIEYYPDGTVKKVEYHDHNTPIQPLLPVQDEEFDWGRVVNPEDNIIEVYS